MRISTSLLALVLIGIGSLAAAQTPKTPSSQHNDRHIQDRNDLTSFPQPEPEKHSSPIARAEEDTLSLTPEQLQTQPELIVRALAAAVIQNHAENTAFLLPYYFRLPENQQNPILIQWGQAVIAQGRRDYATAVRQYRAIIAEQPSMTLIRYRLAEALFADKQWEAAEDQFNKLQSEAEIPKAPIQRYLQAIQQQNRWELTGGISYLNDHNINNAPKKRDLGGGWTAPQAESGQGISYQFGIAKKHSLPKGFFGQWQLDANGKHYWNNKRYNELTARTALGLGHQNARYSIMIAPFIEQTLYAGGNQGDKTLQRFSRSQGLSAQWRYQLHPKWQINLSGETAKQRYRTRTHLNGRSHSLSSTILFVPNAKQYWFGGADWNRAHTRDGDDSYVRNGIRVGWGQEWYKGLSSRISATYAHKNYRAAGFFGERQRNKESSLQASIWHRNWHIAGITPRLTWYYQKTKSNLPLYTYDKHRVFIEVSKQF